jgi:ElaA protein
MATDSIINPTDIDWTCLPFSELTGKDVYDMLYLRNRVFVLEQNCVYLDTDAKDLHAWHVLGKSNGNVVAYARLLPPGISYNELCIGRVVCAPEVRRTGVGRSLMTQAISLVQRIYGYGAIRISAQCYLEQFYRDFGFETVGEIYLEDGLPHIEMYRKGE